MVMTCGYWCEASSGGGGGAWKGGAVVCERRHETTTEFFWSNEVSSLGDKNVRGRSSAMSRSCAIDIRFVKRL